MGSTPVFGKKKPLSLGRKYTVKAADCVLSMSKPPPPFSVSFHVKDLVPVFDKHKDNVLIQILSEKVPSANSSLKWNKWTAKEEKKTSPSPSEWIIVFSTDWSPSEASLALREGFRMKMSHFVQRDCLWCLDSDGTHLIKWLLWRNARNTTQK